MRRESPEQQDKYRQWELMRAYRSLDPEKQKRVLEFVLALEAGTAVMNWE